MYITHYKSIQQVQKKGIRNFLRKSYLDIFSSINTKTSLKPRIQFVFFHYALKDELKNLEKNLTNLSKYYTFISYSEAHQRILQNRIDKPYLCFSSDDGFKNNLNAAKIFEQFGISFCLFLNPKSIGMPDFKSIQEFCEKQLEIPPMEFLTWKEVEYLQKQGHEIGSHTFGHINLGDTNIEEAKKDISLSKKKLTKYCGEIKHFAYPYGRYHHINKAIFDYIYKIGFDSCASAERGCHFNYFPIPKEKLLIRRDLVVFYSPPKHLLYFLNKNANQSKNHNCHFSDL